MKALGSIRLHHILLAALLAAPVWSAHAAAPEPSTGVAGQIAAAPGSGGVLFDLGDAPDATVVADARSLAREVEGTLDRGSHGPRIVIRHLGKGRLMDGDANADGAGDDGSYDPADERRDDPSTESSMVAFNARSGNEFLISTSTRYLATLAAEAERTGLNRETDVRADDDPRTVSTTPALALGLPMAIAALQGGDPEAGLDSWSNGVDDRFRVYGVNAGVAGATNRRRVQLGGGCTGTLVGPRHVVTAGHCLWSRKNQAWSDDFWVAAGRNGTSSVASVLVDNDNIPGGQVLWYFTPSSFRDPANTSTGPVDFGILVLPGRLGDTTGWYGWWVLAADVLQSNTVLRAGYPACTASINGVPRIDEPSPCSPNHLYANSNACGLGEFANAKDGWSRTFNHSCDASAGDSGSGLYLNYNGNGNGVTGIHTTSLCATTATAAACTGSLVSRPLRAVRITPEYAGWISYFRNKYP